MARRILLVEDEPGIQLAMRGILRREGHDVSIAATGDAALKAIAAEARAAGVADYVPKPFDNQQVRDVVRRALGTRDTGA